MGDVKMVDGVPQRPVLRSFTTTAESSLADLGQAARSRVDGGCEKRMAIMLLAVAVETL